MKISEAERMRATIDHARMLKHFTYLLEMAQIESRVQRWMAKNGKEKWVDGDGVIRYGDDWPGDYSWPAGAYNRYEFLANTTNVKVRWPRPKIILLNEEGEEEDGQTDDGQSNSLAGINGDSAAVEPAPTPWVQADIFSNA